MANGFIFEGDCLDLLKEMVDEGLTVQSIVCDPPYGLSFMGRYWDQKDNIAFHPAIWRLCLDLLSPGGHLVAFGGTRTYHRLVCAVEDAGFEIRDQLAWVYGTGFPKSLDVAKAIDKAAGAEREVIGSKFGLPGYRTGPTGKNDVYGAGLANGDAKCVITAPATDAAREWDGWGTALKPAWEPIVLARKPVIGTVASNVLAHSTGALNIDGCRIEGSAVATDLGRWPANICHDGSEEVLEIFESFGERGGGDQRGKCNGRRPGGFGDVGHDKGDGEPNATVYADSGSAARFFYCAKASKKERAESKHPTVKPVALMRWLVRLVTPPAGIVLDPFAGTGTTGEAAHLEGFSYILVEREPEYVRDIERRLVKYG